MRNFIITVKALSPFKLKNVILKNFTILINLWFIILTIPVVGQNMKPNRIFHQGDVDFLAGFSLLPTFLKDDVRQDVPPVSIRIQGNLVKNYSLGIEYAYSKTTSNIEDPFSDKGQYQNRYSVITLRNTIHCNCENIDNWDIYGGFALGLSHSRIAVVNGEFGYLEKLYGIKPVRNQMTYYGFLGFRYACSSIFSFFGEIGYGASIVQAGVGYKLWGD